MLYSPLHSDEELEKEILCVDGGITWLLQIYRGQWVFHYQCMCTSDTMFLHGV